MTDKFNPQFTPDTIDEQIDLATQKDEQNAHSTDRTIQALQQHYAPAQDYSQSLESVWSRFTSQRPPLETVEQDVYSRQLEIVRGRPDKWSSRGSEEFSGLLFRRSGMVAAVVFLVLIVSGMVALPQLLHHSNQAALQTKSVTTTPTFSAVIGEQSTYSVIPTDTGNAYLYTGTSNLINAGQSQKIALAQPFRAHSGKLVEVNAQKGGTKIWSYKGDLFSAPLLADGILYVPSQTGVDALRASDHTLLWHRNLLLTFSDANNGTLYAFDQDAGLEALRASDGALLWQSKHKLALWIDKDIVYTTENFAYINALRASDGALLWRVPLVDNTVEVENGVVFLHTSSYGIRALNGKTGALLWSSEHINDILTSQNGLVYATDGDGNGTIIALRAKDGQILWHYQPLTTDSRLLSNNTAYISTAENVVALNLNTGKLLWQAKTSGQLELVKDGVLYLERTGQGNPTTFLALKASDGSLLWRSNDIKHLYSSSVQAQRGILYMAADDQTIVALKASDGTILARYKADIL